ncbi:hypothetical protein LINPERHAP1_LOCUS8122 [Linum perenne]
MPPSIEPASASFLSVSLILHCRHRTWARRLSRSLSLVPSEMTRCCRLVIDDALRTIGRLLSKQRVEATGCEGHGIRLWDKIKSKGEGTKRMKQ